VGSYCCAGLWEHGLEKLQEFHKLANSLHPRIKTELRFSSQQIEFLDVNIKIKNGFIQTDLFSKDAFSHAILASFLGTLGYNALTFKQNII
jgi:hypothetical protein